MLEGIYVQINIQTVPMKMSAVQQLNLTDLREAGFLEPRKIRMGQEIFFPLDQEPDPIF